MRKKFYPKLAMQFPAIVTSDEGIRLKVIGLEVSTEGLTIQCSTAERNLITPRGSFIHNGRPLELDLQINLSKSSNQENIVVARCHVIFSRRITKNTCQIGLVFLEISDENHTRIKRLIETSSIATAA